MSLASKITYLLVSILFLNGCLNDARFASLEPAVTVHTAPENIPKADVSRSVANPSHYLVKPGDTLYSIAFRFGLDYRKLAAANGIGGDFRIYEGQSIALKEGTSIPVSATDSAKKRAEPVKRDHEYVVTKDNSQKNDTQSIDNSQTKAAVESWMWPHDGKIVRTFRADTSTRKGIDLTGRIGDSVVAATNGVVVYAGNGLPGYGNLIILEHQGSLLSAYAFTEDILVAEKDRVRAGQQIATMGKQGDQPGLHFEIRRNGKPVDPQTYLPKR